MERVTVRTLVLSSFALDGGAMHGVVPRTLWERVHPADARHRIRLVARAVLVEHAASGARVLIELGLGQRWTEKERGIYAIDQGPEVPSALAAAGVDPATITHVILTHLHWDHAGGVLLRNGLPAFPRAEHVVAAECLDYAARPAGKDQGSFRADDIKAVLGHPKLRRWREGDTLAPGVVGCLAGGHTEGQLIPIIPGRLDGPPLAVPTDLIPTRSHLSPKWVMAYDNHPVVTVEEKKRLIDQMARIGGGVVLYHDPLVEVGWAVLSGGEATLIEGALDKPPL